MSQDKLSSQAEVPWQQLMMVTDNANVIIFLATYNLLEASEML